MNPSPPPPPPTHNPQKKLFIFLFPFLDNFTIMEKKILFPKKKKKGKKAPAST